MSYAAQQTDSTKRLAGILFVVAFHLVLIYALVNGLARKVVEVVKGPLETKIIQEFKPPSPETPPPPPKLVVPPPPFIPPPEVNITEAASAENTIAAVSTTLPVATPTPTAAVAPTGEAVHKAPIVKAKSCSPPEYPAASERMDEAGKVILSLLVGTDGHVVDSKVETSSGYQRLDRAAKEA